MEENFSEEQSETQVDAGEKPENSAKKQFLQILIFTGFSISAGVIQLLSFTVLYEWGAWLKWWPAYLISIVLSVIWNFTFNRKFTFRAANNDPVAMLLVVIYYAAFIPASVFGGNALEAAWGEKFGIAVTVLMMVLNFITEFLWDKFIVFNNKVTDKIVNLFRKKN